MAAAKRAPKKSTTPDQIKGKAAVVVGKYHSYDPRNPGATPVEAFAYSNLEDGGIRPDSYYAREGYVCIGTADITITLLPERQVTENQVAALRKQKTAVQANAVAKCAQIDREIQSLLAITAG